MKSSLLSCSLALVLGAFATGSARAQAAVADRPVAPALPAGSRTQPIDPRLVLAAHAPETVLIPSLRGVIFVSTPGEAAQPVPSGFTGVDVSRVGLFRVYPGVEEGVRLFLDRPASLPSLGRIALFAQFWLKDRGQGLVFAYVPPQDLTDGVVRVVVAPARLEGDVVIEGAKWFSDQSYREALRLEQGSVLNAAQLAQTVERLNANPYRRVVLAAEPGAAAGTTRLVLRTQEVRPWNFTVGYNNTGTNVTDENRITAGAQWGNAFGRGDTLGYSFTADPAVEHLQAHSANYATTFGAGYSLAAFGSWSHVKSVLPEPLTQEGTSWQAGLRFGVPLRAMGRWTPRLELAADFKYSDNNLDFALIPITNNVTHIAQAGVTYSLSRQGQRDNASVALSVFGSPGGITAHNDDASFAGSRAGASASYVYARLEGRYSHALSHGWTAATRLSLQIADGPLLGVEQLAGAGSSAVRGYRESSVFGDEGAVGSVELHAPAHTFARMATRLDAFVFSDAGVLHDFGLGGGNTDLASAGPGVNVAIGKYLSLSAAYGWQLKEVSYLAGQDSGYGHLSATLRF